MIRTTLITLALLCGCAGITGRTVDYDAAKPAVDIVAARTQAYVSADETLTPADVAQFDAELANVYTWVNGAAESGEILATGAAPSIKILCDRHDAYIMGDASIDPLLAPHYLRTTLLLRRMFDEAAAVPR